MRTFINFLTERWTASGNACWTDENGRCVGRLPGYVAYDGDELVGLVTLIKRDGEWEILTLDSSQ